MTNFNSSALEGLKLERSIRYKDNRNNFSERMRGSSCLCQGCGHIFKSPAAFDKHQRLDHCLDEDEMINKGMCINDKGYWVTGAYNDFRNAI